MTERKTNAASREIVRLEGVTRTFAVGDVEINALRGVTLSIRAGEFVAIVGSSGSGKSTLMSILGCLDRPSSGRYYFEGIDVAALDEQALAGIRNKRLGFVFQSFNLLPRTSALENVSLPLYYAETGTRKSATRVAQARAMLTRLGIGPWERNTPGQLSGGQQQRVAIARALINTPGMLLADEPTGNLDTRNSHEIMEVLVGLNREQGVTVILVTHEADIAAYADRVVTMRDGEVISDEPIPSVKPRAPMAAMACDEAGIQVMSDRVAGAPREAIPDIASVWVFSRMVLGTAVQAITRNKMRSALTMLGVFIGVAALIVMVAVGQGASEAVRERIQSLGTNVVVILPGATQSGGARVGFGSASSLTIADARAILREDRAVRQVGYLIRQQGQVRYQDQNWTTAIQGVSVSYPSITNWRIAAGRGIQQDDDDRDALVVVIGQTVYRQLFRPGDNPIGAYIQVRSVPLRVIGTLAAKGQTPFGQDQDDLIMVPFTTAERRVIGAAAPTQQRTAFNWPYLPTPNPYNLQPRLTGYVNQIFVQAARQDLVQAAIDQATRTLAIRHRLQTLGPKDFDVRNLSQIAETVESSSRIMALLLAAVASISLLVGGIGIMNILLVSVTERTREIGLRMAIGARRVHVLLQFLSEAVLLSVSGGAAGIGLSIAFSALVSTLFGWPAPFSLPAVFGGFAFAVAVGVFFGYYPARKAAHLDPIEALRYE